MRRKIDASELRIIDKWGKNRPAEEFTCLKCGKLTIKRVFKNRPNRFCSRECYLSTMFKGTEVPCLNCNKVTKRCPSKFDAWSRHFCSRKCKDAYSLAENHPGWNNGKSSYRARALRKYGEICSNPNCPIKFEFPVYMLEVDHIDGNRNNNKLENLRILCTWCHRVKTIITNVDRILSKR